MSIFGRTVAILPVLLAAVILALLSNSVQAAVISCNSCSDCNSKIANAAIGDTVQLTANINNQVGSCILFGGKDDVTFDCLGNTIDGDYTWDYDYGIWLNQTVDGSNNNTIRNCTVTNFYYGIGINSSSNNTIMNVTSNYNVYAGIWLAASSGNTLKNITAKENIHYDLYVTATSDSHCNNFITDILSTGNRLIKYFDSFADLQDETLAGLVLCNADESNINNITITGSQFYNNNGVLAIMTDYVTLTNINSSSNYIGIRLYNSSHNWLANIMANYNSNGIKFDISPYNTLENALVNSNGWYGVYIADSNYCTLNNITSNSNAATGLYVDNCVNSMITNVTVKENTYSDFNLYGPCANTILNVTGSGDRPFKYFNSTVNLHDEILSGLFLCDADYSNVTNITITGSASKKNNYFYISNTDYSNFTNINSSYRYNGIGLYSSTHNILTNITASYNYYTGFTSSYSSYNNVTNLAANYNSNYGVYVTGGPYNTFRNANANSNSRYGILIYSSNNTFTNATASNNRETGIYLMASRYNVISKSRAENNSNYGIYLDHSCSETCYYSVYSRFYNNYLNNTANLYSTDSNNLNYWNATLNCSGGPNIIGGIPVAGNYWTNPTHTGFSDTCVDTNSKGICDSPYTPVPNNIDYLPLSSPRPDTTPPTIVFVSPTPPNNTKVSGDYIQVNISFQNTQDSCLDETPYSCFLNWYNGVVWINYTMAKSGMSCYVNMTGLFPGIIYQYMVYANDVAENMNVSETRQNSVLDAIPPAIAFVPPTPPNGITVQSNYIEVNISVSEPAGTCLLDWWYGGAWNNYSMALAPGSLSCYINMTDLPNGLYMFRVYANDTAGNMNVSETRQNTLSYAGPLIILSKFSAGMVYLEMGKNGIVKVYVNNPDSQFANISIWLGGNYPAALAKFSAYPGIYYTADMRNATVGLNPKEQRVLDLIMYSTGPGEYIINVTATTTASSKKDFDSIKLFIGYPPSFPGLELWGILLILVVSGLAYWKIKK